MEKSNYVPKGMCKYILDFGQPYERLSPLPVKEVGYVPMSYTILAPSDGVAKEKMNRFIGESDVVVNGKPVARQIRRLMKVLMEV